MVRARATHPRMRRSRIAVTLGTVFPMLPAKARMLRIVAKLEGGPMTSLTLRSLLKKHYKVTVGNYSYGSLLEPGRADPHTTIGSYASIGPGVRRFGAAHPLSNASLHPYWYNPALGIVPKQSDVHRSPIHIGHDCWIGANVTILPGCSRIGIGAVIGAGSVVTRDVEDYEIVVGNPARVVRTRLASSVRTELLRSQYWRLDPREALDQLQAIIEHGTSPTESNRRPT